MGRLYESLQRAERERRQPGASGDEIAHTPELLGGLIPEPFELESVLSATIEIRSKSHLVALADPKCLAAEKFRALVTRLEHLRNERELKSLLITSSIVNEGKTFVAGNLAVTLAKHFGSRVLLIEGDLHRPALASLLGLTRLQGLSHWWSTRKDNIAHYVYKINGMPLWFFGAGESCDQPSQILQSAEFAEAFSRLRGSFDWILVDSPPMLPTADVNLWSRLVDGTLLVVREGVAPVKALEQGLASLDKPKLVGIVLNETSEVDQRKYAGQYYGSPKSGKKILNEKH
jgi:capsular exopolysaccharide synthesis family protein